MVHVMSKLVMSLAKTYVLVTLLYILNKCGPEYELRSITFIMNRGSVPVQLNSAHLLQGVLGLVPGALPSPLDSFHVTNFSCKLWSVLDRTASVKASLDIWIHTETLKKRGP